MAWAARAALVAVALATAGGDAHAATFPVACGSGASALTNAVNSANASTAEDTIVISGGPCTFSLSSPASTGANGNNSGLLVTQPLIIEGNGSTIERSTSAALAFRVLFANSTALTLRDLTIQRGLLTGANVGAGVAGFSAAVVVERSKIVQNTASSGTAGANGGGIATVGGSLRVEDSTIAFNIANAGGGISTTATGTGAAPATVRRSTFQANQASSVAGAYVQGGVVRFENDTFAANVASNGVAGIAAGTSGATPGVVDVASSTFVDATQAGSTSPANALYASAGTSSATINVADSVVTDGDSVALPIVPPCATTPGGTINDLGGNLEWPANTCSFGTVQNPGLTGARFGAWGGPTSTYRPLPGSPVIDLGGASCPATDQRGATRPDGDGCDAGAYETPAPETQVQGPGAITNDPAVVLSSPDTPGASFECAIGDGDYAPCSSPYEPALSDGTYTVHARARDGLGYPDPSPASATFEVDTTAPDVEITTAPAPASNESSPGIAFRVDDDDATVTCTLTGEDPVECDSPWKTGDLADGTYTITVTATDAAGNAATDSVQFTIDTERPEVTITAAPPAHTPDATPTVEFSVDDEDAVTSCWVDDTVPVACDGAYTPDELPDGPHSITVRAVDLVGNEGAQVASFTIDTVAPAAASGWALDRSSPSKDAEVRVSATTEAGAQVELFDVAGCTGTPVEQGAGLLDAPGVLVPVAENSATTFSASVVDAAGNRSACSSGPTFVHDGIAPAPVITSPVDGSSATATTRTFSGSAGTDPGDLAAVDVQITRDGELVSTLTAPRDDDGAFAVTSGPLAPGTYAARAVQVDSAGNVGLGAPVTFTVAPVVTEPGGGDDGPPAGPADPGPSTEPATIAIVRRTLRYAKGKVRITLRCTGAAGTTCAGDLSLRPAKDARRKATASRAYSLPAGADARVAVKPTRTLRKLLARRRTVRVRVTAVPSSGAPVVSARLKVVRKKR